MEELLLVRLHPLPERPEHLALRPHGRAVGRASVVVGAGVLHRVSLFPSLRVFQLSSYQVLEEAQLELVRQVLRLEQQRVAEERARHLDVLPELEAEEHAHAPEPRLVRQLVAPLAGALPALLHVLALVLPARPARLPLGHRSDPAFATSRPPPIPPNLPARGLMLITITGPPVTHTLRLPLALRGYRRHLYWRRRYGGG
ncbi:hypothetical protein FIBSPDRAFT_967169 [Athelia psychrophila]|uniref:Uncharacterized protein n=1 Tax=Athelia psychrophila TaxID=1759441 RepID=A0A167W0W1_9AGAM|nr:hypothetical protein FIBSPDRAFT_967169 [Fibularhizoctonia sp. CBS 109695]